MKTREEDGELFDRFWKKMTDMAASRDGVIVAATRKERHEFMVGQRLDPSFSRDDVTQAL